MQKTKPSFSIHNTFVIALCVLLLFSLTACGQAAEGSVSSEAGTSSAVGSTSEEAEPLEGMVSMDELQELCEDPDLGSWGNLTFKEGLTIEAPETVYQRELMVMGDFADEYSEVLMHWWVPDEVWDDQYLTPQEDQMNYYPLGPTYSDDAGWYADVWCVGTVYYEGGPGQELCNQYLQDADNMEPWTLVAEYPLFCSDEGLEDSYELMDGSITVAEAAQMGNEFAQEWCALTDYPLTLEVQYVQVYQSEAGDTLLYLIYQDYYEGVPIVDVSDENDSRTMDSFDPDVYRDFGHLKGYLTSTQGICEWGGGSGGLEPYGEAEPCEEILSPAAAAQILSDTLSRYTSYEVQGVQLQYRLTYTGNVQTEEQYRSQAEDGTLQSDRDGAPWCNYVSYELYETHPVWAFWMQTDRDDELVCFVDCLTGDVSLIDNR